MLKRFIPAFYLLTHTMVFGSEHQLDLQEIRPYPINRASFRMGVSFLNSSFYSPTNSSTTSTTTQTLTTQKKLNHTTIASGDTLLQHEADAAIILNRFYPNFLTTLKDYDKLTCREFCDKIITIYSDSVIGFYETIVDGFEDVNRIVYERIEDQKELKNIAQDLNCRLPSWVETKISRSIENYLDTITFS